jgi:hypothetical protein
MNMKNIFDSGQCSSRFDRYESLHEPFLHEIVFIINPNTLRGNVIGKFV